LERGVLLTPEDQLRKHIINQIMCNLNLDFEELATRFGLDAPIDLAPELTSLAPLEALGLVILEPSGLQVTEAGRLVVRNVAAAFDPGLAAPQRAPRFSQAV
jgi:oxygen-independent coproporphyrinogen-3 oxidase